MPVPGPLAKRLRAGTLAAARFRAFRKPAADLPTLEIPMPRPWTVLPHDPIAELAPNLWNIDAPVPGMPLRRRMVVVKLEDGRLVLHNGVCLDEASMQRLESWGEPAFVIVPCAYHRIDAHAFGQRYPQAKVLAPAQSAAKVREVVRVDGTLADLPKSAHLQAEPLTGSKLGEHVLRVTHDGDVTLVFNDAVMNNPHGKGLWWWTYRYLTRSTGGPMVTGLFKLAGVNDRNGLRRDLERLADTPGLVRVIPGHGLILEGDAAAQGLRTAAGTL